MVIETERLKLRPFNKGDAADLYEYLKDPTPNCFKDMKLCSLDEAKHEAAARERSDDNFMFAAELKDGGKVIGEFIGHPEKVGPVPCKNADTYSVCWMLNKAYQGKGLAKEAASALLNALFSNGARRVFAYVEDYNIPSQKLCEALGMRREALFKEYVTFVDDEKGSPIYENTYVYSILRKEWEASKSNAK